MRGSDAVIEMLISHGVEHVFGVPGDTSMNFHDSFLKRTDRIKHILCRDERSAGYMADAYARVSGKPGVVETPSGGGALYVVPAVSEANISCIPLICISSEITMSSDETNALTDTNQEDLFKPITKWNTKVKMAAKIPHLFRKAFRIATGGVPGAVHLALPENILEQEIAFSQEELSGPDCRHAPFRNEPNSEVVDKVVQLLFKASRPVILAGGGTHLSGAYEELEAFVDAFHVPVATSVNGKGSIQEYSPYAIGTIGANGGSKEGLELVQSADLVLVLGSKLNAVTTMGKVLFDKSAKIIQVDIGERVLDGNVRADVAIMSDIRSFLARIGASMRGRQAAFTENLKIWNAQVTRRVGEKRARINDDIDTEAQLVTPARVFEALERLTDEETIFVADAGTPTPYLSAYFRLKKAGRYSVLPRAHGSLGYALPAAIGVQVARPNARVISLQGDASFGMAVGDLETAVRCKLPVVFLNFQNNSYGWIKTLQRLYYDENYFAVDFGRIDAVKIAEGFGLKARRVDSNADLDEKIGWAMNQNEPVLLDLMIEPPTRSVPPVLKWERDVRLPAAERKKLTY